MIRILIDSTSDYSLKEIKEKGLELIPIKIIMDGVQYIEGENIERTEFYEKMIETNSFPQTSQPSPQEFIDIFEDVKEKNDEMICILLSSSLSGTYQSATIAKEMINYDKIYIIDSLTATVCIKMLADNALSLLAQGKSAKETVEETEKLKSRVKCIATLNTLEYLAKGGRLNRSVAAIGNVAKLKPIITLTENGEVGVMKKCIGLKQGIVKTVQTVKDIGIDENYPVYGIYSYGTENLEELENKLQSENITFTDKINIGPTIGAHIGPEAFGVIFISKE